MWRLGLTLWLDLAEFSLTKVLSRQAKSAVTDEVEEWVLDGSGART